MPSFRPRARLRPVVLAALAMGLCQNPGPVAATPIVPSQPNIVLIMTDDEDVAIHEFMPKTKALLEERGVRFDNFFVTYSFCCPSRASILRGQYPHNTHIVGNEQPWGGFEKFRQLGLEESTVATWLQGAGYHTAMIGKYLNRYAPERDGVPPGWDEWYVGGNAHTSYDYILNENGRTVAYGSAPEDYLNDVLTDKAVQVIRGASAARQPFFVYVLPYTPHSPSVAAPRHEGMFADVALPRTPAFDEADVGDKPDFIRRMPPLGLKQTGRLEEEYRRRLRSLQAVDDMVERIVGALEATHQLDHTYVIYSSDNGFHLGEHRLPAGKDFLYEEDIRVPAVVRGPGVPEGVRIEPIVLNNDFAPTFAEIAGIEAPDFVDGRSFLPLFEDSSQPWRESFLIARRQLENQYVDLAERLRMTPDEIEQAAQYDAIRTRDLMYAEYGTGERELYELAGDPHQLDNVVESADPALVTALAARLAGLRTCSAAKCRELEDLAPTDNAAPRLAAQP